MQTFEAIISITLKNGVLDAQGKAIHNALSSLNFKNINDVRAGKIFIISIDAQNKQEAECDLQRACELLLVNNVIENFSIEMR